MEMMHNHNTRKISVFMTSKLSGEKIAPVDHKELQPKSISEQSPSVTIHRDKIKQEVLGFGGAFTEASASVYKQCTQEKKEEIIKAYFDHKNGHGYSFCRTHINSCDFSLGNYAYCETNGDSQLNNFSIEHDKTMLIPFIKDALKESTIPLHILASPWSPPGWMKTNREMNNGGKLKDEYRDAWAHYFCKYVKAYENEGIPIWGVSVQNEPAAKQVWDSCLYSAEEEKVFVRDYLGPAFTDNYLQDKKIVIWDHNRDIMVERAETVLNDPKASKYVWGTGFHWYNGDHFDNVQKVHDEFPDKHLIFTEVTQEGGAHIGSWDLGERYARSVINDMNRWTVAWIDWNLLLNEQGGPNYVGNYCSAPIIVDTKNNKILYQSSYYYLGHFSRFIKRGDHIIQCDVDLNSLLALAAIDSSGALTVVIMNENDSSIDFTLRLTDESFPLRISPHSIFTIVMNPN